MEQNSATSTPPISEQNRTDDQKGLVVPLYSYNKLILYAAAVLILILSSLIIYRFLTGSNPSQTVKIVGKGSLDAPTDQVGILARIDSFSTDATKALDDNKRSVDQFRTRLTSQGVAESSIHFTTNSGPVAGSTGNYFATSDFTIILDDLSLVDKVTGTINSTNFVKPGLVIYALKDPKPHEEKAKDLAIKDAQNQIEKIAQTNKSKVGKIVSIKQLDENPKKLALPSGNSNVAPTDNKLYAVPGEKVIHILSSYELEYELK